MAEPRRHLKLDPDVHDKVQALADWLGMTPDQLVADAVVAYLRSHRDALEERVQERMRKMFSSLENLSMRVPLPLEE